MNPLIPACVAGYENLVVWADLLDRINVFPVADGDTGTNLRVSLAPLRHCKDDMAGAVARLPHSASGNSGNIAAAFFRDFLQAQTVSELGLQAAVGRDKAWQAIGDPRPGTMLGVFDAICLVLNAKEGPGLHYPSLQNQLHQATLATAYQLSELERAGVVDSGALGMFIFFDGFFQQLTGKEVVATPVIELFAGKLQISASYSAPTTDEYCVDALLQTSGEPSSAVMAQIAALGESAVLMPDSTSVKVHLHTSDPEQLRDELSRLGQVVNWSDEAMAPLMRAGECHDFSENNIRIMSDAAGSIPLELARQHGIILLDSYILAGDQGGPESLFSADLLYSMMKTGVKVSTAQASNHERHLHYEAACRQYDQVLYLCVGSAFTGNYSTVMAWKEEHDPTNRLQVIDSGAASGRLAVIALLTARLAVQGAAAEKVVAYAQKLVEEAEEYIFLHELKYLVAGGRVSRSKGFFADLLHKKPVISPAADGVRKVGVVKNRGEQLAFGLEKLASLAGDGRGIFVLLQYSDNREWLQDTVDAQIRRRLPQAEIQLVPLSLTSGIHMGPGTWAMAFASGEDTAC